MVIPDELDNDASFAIPEPTTAEEFRELLHSLHAERKARKLNNSKERRRRRDALSESQRATVLSKTAKRCHICGGTVGGRWQADHVLAVSGGGTHAEDNFLAAHSLCNNYRWDYLAEEFQYILKLGVWVRTQIERGKGIGPNIAERFMRYEQNRRKRRKRKKG